MPAALLLVDAHRRVVWANPAARALLRLTAAGAGPLDSCGPVGDALDALAVQLAQARARHEWWRRVAVSPAAVLQVVARRVDAGHCALLARSEATTHAAAHRALVEELELSPPEARLALRVHGGLPVPAIAAAFGVGVGSIRMRLLRLRQRLQVARHHDLFVAIDEVLAGLPLAPGWPPPGDDLGAAAGAGPLAAPTPAAVASFLRVTGVGLVLCAADGPVVWANRTGRELLVGGAGEAAGRGRAGRLEVAVRRLAAPPDADRGGVVVTLESAPAELRARLWRAGPGQVGVELQAARLPAPERAARIRSQLGLEPVHARIAEQVVLGRTAAQLAKVLGIDASRARVAVGALGRQVGAPDATELVYALRRLIGAPTTAERRPRSRPEADGAARPSSPSRVAPVRGVRAVALGHEVSNRVPLILLALCKRRGLTPATLLRGLDLSEGELRDTVGRHGWEQFVTLLDRMAEALGGRAALDECMAEMVLSNDVGYVLAGILISPARTYGYGIEHVLRSLFRNLGMRFEVQGDGRLRLELGFPAGYRVSPTCWHAVAGALRVVPRLWRQPDALVELDGSAQRATFLVTAPGSRAAPERDLDSVSPWLTGILGGLAAPACPPAPGEPAFQVEMALDGYGNVETAQLLGQRLAGRTDVADFIAELETVLREHFLILRAALWGRARAAAGQRALWLAEDGDPTSALYSGRLLVDGVEVGHLDVEAPVAQSPLFRSLLPWIAVGLERVTRADDDRDPSAQVAQAARAWGLSRRQHEVLARVVAGLSNKEVAAALGCSVRAVEVHLTRVFGLVGVTSRTALVAQVWGVEG